MTNDVPPSLTCPIPDLHLWQGYYRTGSEDKDILEFSQRPGFNYPKVPGHEISGSVYALGDRVQRASGLVPGDRVIIMALVGCDECPACSVGDTHLCMGTMKDLGFTEDGGYSEFVTVPHYKYIFKTPDGVRDETAALLACSALTAFTAIKLCSPTVGRVRRWGMDLTVAVIGVGGVGQWLVKLIRRCIDGVRLHLVGLDVDESKLDHLTMEKSVEGVFLLEKSLPPAEQSKLFLEKFDGRKPFVIFDFVNVPQTFDFALQSLHSGGMLVPIGMHGGRGSLALPQMILNAHSIASTMMGSLTDLAELLALVGRDPTCFSPPPITCYPLETANDALRDLKSGRVLGRAVLKMNTSTV